MTTDEMIEKMRKDGIELSIFINLGQHDKRISVTATKRTKDVRLEVHSESRSDNFNTVLTETYNKFFDSVKGKIEGMTSPLLEHQSPISATEDDGVPF